MDNTTVQMLALFAAVLAAIAVQQWLREQRARRWPTTLAVVVETGPSSFLQGSGRTTSLNRDSDHFLEWTVDGNRHQHRLEDRADVVFAGIRLFRVPPRMEKCRLHYNPDNPDEHLVEADLGSWRLLAFLSAAFLCGSGIAYVT